MAIRNWLLHTATALVVTGAGIATFGTAASAADPGGVWLTADQSARIRIEPCNDGYWGVIDWEKQAGTDDKNPDPAKRGRPLLGTPILMAMKPAQTNLWQGKIYNPKDGGVYTARISLPRPEVLKLEGCMLIFCGGENWTRVADQPQVTTGAASTQPRARSACPGGAHAAAQRRN